MLRELLVIIRLRRPNAGLPPLTTPDRRTDDTLATRWTTITVIVTTRTTQHQVSTLMEKLGAWRKDGRLLP